MTKFSEKWPHVRDISIFCTQKGAFALQDNITWLVETEIAFFVEQQYFISTTAGQIEAKRHAHFPKILAQNLECLAALWSDLDEKLSSWS